MSKMGIKNTAINSLAYTGIVTLSQYIGQKKVVLSKMHNAGGKPLFNFLASCLLGDFAVASPNRPCKIMLLQEDNSDGIKVISKAANTDFIYLLSKPEQVYSENNESIVKYSFIIPQDYFTGTSFNAIGLYADSATKADIEDYAAIVSNVNFDAINVSISSVLVLDWELHISN